MKTLLIALRALIYLPQKSDVAGIVVGALGVILVLACAEVFVVRGRGTPAVFDPPREFVAVGPHKYVRNPMYIGGLALLIGFGLYLHSISILILSVFLFFALHLFVVFYEEPTLRQKFGLPYEKYCSTVSRWIPRTPHARRNI